MRIGIDVDGVLANFYTAYEQLAIDVDGVDRFGEHKWPNELPCTWNWPEHYGYSNETMREVWTRIRNDAYFWQDLIALPDMSSLKARFNSVRHDWYFITARPGFRVQHQTVNWFLNHGFYNVSVLISGRKGLCCRALNLDVYIDDKGENILDVQQESPSTHAILLNRPYNTEFRVDKRAATLEEVFNGYLL